MKTMNKERKREYVNVKVLVVFLYLCLIMGFVTGMLKGWLYIPLICSIYILVDIFWSI